MEHSPVSRARRGRAGVPAALALGVIVLAGGAGCASSEKKSDADTSALPQDNSLSPSDQMLRDVQRERQSERPNVR